MIASTSNFYQVGASLPVDAPSYVKRQADEVFYQKLQAGKFCYVLNSRQMGKSSLRVQTMQRLQKEGTICAAIDLTGIGKVSQQQWYGGIVYNLSESCQLEDKFDFDWQEWWQKHQTVLSPVQCLSLFIEKVLLAKIEQPIVIFVDEIDKVLSQEFSADDFFGLIRFFQNQRVDNPIFQRLTFALLGVATPGDLIQNKTQTPFNIGEAIELHGFKFDEVEPLIEGLRGKCDRSQIIMKEILDWTGGQPFLTQKLCKFMVEESEKDNCLSVKEVVKSRIIENWESQDDPEHLRTIRDRILSSEQRAGYLLELYQQIQQRGEVAAKKNLESSELRLSGLVVQREGKLRVYNRVYQRVFNKNWVEVQLKNLRPYSEAFRFWVASGYSDESRLLRGKALTGAERWAKRKNLSFEDKQFLAASREKEIALRNQQAELERERKDKEATEKRNLVLSEANKKAKRRIRNGTFILVAALLGAVSLGVFGVIEGNKALQSQEKAKDAKQLVIAANQKVESADKKAEQIEKKFEDIKQQAQTATEKAKAEKSKAKQAENKAKLANQKATEAREEAEKAEQSTDKANQEAIKATEKAEAEQRKAEKAKQEAQNLQNQLASVKEGIEIVKKDVETVQALSELAGELRNKNLTAESDEALRQAGLSFRVKDHNLKQAMLLASMSQAYQNLKKTKEAEKKIAESLKYLNNKGNKIISTEGLQIKVLVKGNQGNLLANKSKQQAINAYQEAFRILKNHSKQTNPFENNQILTPQDIESVHRGLLNLQLNRDQEVWISLKEHFYAELQNLLSVKNWIAADIKTDTLMLFIADREEQAYLNISEIYAFSCPDLQRINRLWIQNSKGDFGFSVQKQIWVETGNRLGVEQSDWNRSDDDNYLRFAREVGWYDNAGSGEGSRSFSDLVKSITDVNYNQIKGGLPLSIALKNRYYENWNLRDEKILNSEENGGISRNERFRSLKAEIERLRRKYRQQQYNLPAYQLATTLFFRVATCEYFSKTNPSLQLH